MEEIAENKTGRPHKVSFMYLRSGTTMLVKFDAYEERVARGRIQTLYYKHPFKFRSLDQLLLIMDDVLDSVDFEKKRGDFRCLDGKCEKKQPIFQYIDSEDIYTDEDICNRTYENAFKAELMIRVLYRQNCSMQGEIRVNGKTARFRSSLELLRMLYEFLEYRFGEDNRTRMLEQRCWHKEEVMRKE